MDNDSTLSETMASLIANGYTIDFNAHFVHGTQDKRLSPEDFIIDEVYRFEGLTDPGDEMVLYAISSPTLGKKGYLVSAYGYNAEPEVTGIVKNLKEKIKRDE